MKPKRLTLSFGDHNSWYNVDLIQGNPGYYRGNMAVFVMEELPITLRIEAIEATAERCGFSGAPELIAKNKRYQDRLDAYAKLNSGEVPRLVTAGKKKYFIHIELLSH